jgi:hypothetical protein
MGRRRFLHAVGLGAGTLAVAGATGLTWKAVDGGVFATGTGAAYAAWDELSPSGGDPMGLVRAAVLAANAHNAQPWHFRIAADRIDVFADMSRNLGTMDPLRREMDISLGCALENLVLAGPSNGLAPRSASCPTPATVPTSRGSTSYRRRHRRRRCPRRSRPGTPTAAPTTPAGRWTGRSSTR